MTLFPRTSHRLVLLLVFPALACFASSPAWASSVACETIDRNFLSARGDLATPQLSAMLFSAADNACVALVPELIGAGAAISTRDRTGGTALTHAARSGHVDMARVLIGHGADINARDIGGATPLSIAIETNHGAAAKALIEAGSDVQLAGHSGVTPLIAAAYNGNLTVVDALLRHHANPSVLDATGKSAVLYAAARGFSSIVIRLLDSGVDINARYANGLTILAWAAGYAEDVPASDATALVTELLHRGAQVDAADDRGQTPLMIAAAMNHDELCDLLLAHGASRAARDIEGHRAADLTTSAPLKVRLSS